MDYGVMEGIVQTSFRKIPLHFFVVGGLRI